MLRKILGGKSGIVLVSVLAISITMIIIALSVLSSNVNMTLSGQRQIDRIKAEQIAKGQFWKNYASLLNRFVRRLKSFLSVRSSPPITGV